MGKLRQYSTHIVRSSITGREALQLLDTIPDTHSRTLFIVESNRLVGTTTYGDIRRGLLTDKEISDSVIHFMNRQYKFLQRTELCLDILAYYRKQEIWLLPVLNESNEIEDIIDLKLFKTVIPAAALIM